MLKFLIQFFSLLIFVVCVNSRALSNEESPLCSLEFWEKATAENVFTLLNAGHSLSDKCEEGRFTALEYAFNFMQDPEIINIMSSENLDYLAKRDSGQTLLYQAARGNLSEAVNFLIKKGVSINQVDNNGMSAFLNACTSAGSAEVIKAFVVNGANIHQKSKSGENCLHMSVVDNGRTDVIEYVLSLPLSKDFSECESCVPIIAGYIRNWHFYSGKDDIKLEERILDLLIETGFDINEYKTEQSKYGSGLDVKTEAAIHQAINRGDKETLGWLLKRGANPNYTSEAQKDSPLATALRPYNRNPDLEIISLLVFHGAELNTTKGIWNTPLTNRMNKKDFEDVASHLIDLGADIEFRDENGRTPLLYAAANGYFNAFEFLLGKGANLQAIDSDERNVLHLASQDNSLATVKELYEGVVDPQKLDKDGLSPLHLASLYTYNPLIIRYLASMSMDINAKAKTEYQNPPLHLALWNARYNSIANELIKFGADVNLRNAAGLTPLHVAAITCGARDGKSWYPKTVAMMKILIENGAQINVLDKENNTPLHYASKNCYHPKPVSLLFKSGANIRARNKHGETPIDLISKNNDLKESKIYWDMRDKLLQ